MIFYFLNNFIICYIFFEDMIIIIVFLVIFILKIFNLCSFDRKFLWDKCILDVKF